MRIARTALLWCMLLLLSSETGLSGIPQDNEAAASKPSKLLVIWTGSDPDVAINMVFMYTNAAKKNGWWDRVVLLIWGPSQVLAVHDYEIQKKISEMKKNGVELLACKACSDKYEVSERLERLGVTVKYVGEDLTKMLKDGWTSLTF